jgi:hypothetical protein
MSFILPEEYENENKFQEELKAEKNEASKILMDSRLVNKVVFTDCLIPLQIDAILPTGEMCYGRNARVGGDVTMWVFEEECDLSKGWPPILYTGEKNADAIDYIILAQEMLVLIKQYLEWKKLLLLSKQTFT